MNLIIGGDSIIGKALSEFWKERNIPHLSSTRRMKEISKTRPYIDLERQLSSGLDDFSYNSVVFCAAATKLDECEKNPAKTRKINVDGVVSLAEYFSKKNSYLLFLSSNQVFDGNLPKRTSMDLVNPINEYGRQKAESEKRILKLAFSSVLRLTKVIHSDLPLLKKWGNRLKNGKNIEAYSDLNLSPIMLLDVVEKINNFVKDQIIGLHHFPSMDDISYYTFAQQFAINNNFNCKLIIPINSPHKNTPKYTSLA